MTARFSRAAQQSVEFARTARGHRPRLQLTEYRLNRTSSTSGVLNLLLIQIPEDFDIAGRKSGKFCNVIAGLKLVPVPHEVLDQVAAETKRIHNIFEISGVL